MGLRPNPKQCVEPLIVSSCAEEVGEFGSSAVSVSVAVLGSVVKAFRHKSRKRLMASFSLWTCSIRLAARKLPWMIENNVPVIIPKMMRAMTTSIRVKPECASPRIFLAVRPGLSPDPGLAMLLLGRFVNINVHAFLPLFTACRVGRSDF